MDVVLQNVVALNNRSETHPWHLHRHDFWMGARVGRGPVRAAEGQDPVQPEGPSDEEHGGAAPHGVDGGEVRGGQPRAGVAVPLPHRGARVHGHMWVVFEEGDDKVGRLPNSIITLFVVLWLVLIYCEKKILSAGW